MGSNTSQSTEGWVEDTRFGLIRLENQGTATTSDPSDEDLETNTEAIFVKSKEMSHSEYHRWRKELKQMEEVRAVLLLPLNSRVANKSYCGMNCSIELKFPSYRILFRQEIKNRWKIDKPYTEIEMWHLLYNLVLLGQYYERLGQKIGDIHPQNIVLNDGGVMKVIGKMTLPGQTDNFHKICNDQVADVFLAPEEIDYDCFSKYKYPPGVNPNTAELFSMGMTMLEAGTLQLSSYIYDKGPYRINYGKMSQNLKLFHLKYSIHLFNVVESLLSKKPSSRITCRDLYHILYPYENRIMNMEPFEWPTSRKMGKNYEDSLIFSSNSQSKLINLRSSQASRPSSQQKRFQTKTSPRMKMYHSSMGEGSNI